MAGRSQSQLIISVARGLGVAAVAVAILLAFNGKSLAATAPAPRLQTGSEVFAGTPGVAALESIVDERAAALQALSAPNPVAPSTPITRPFMPRPFLPSGQSLLTASLPAALPGLLSSSPVSLSPTLSNNFQASDNTFWYPPDTMGAVGPGHLMVAHNGRVRIQSRSGAVISTVTLNTFLNKPGTYNIFDPRVLYDSAASRWIFSAVDGTPTGGSEVLVAVSAGSDPTGTWRVYATDPDNTNTNWADYPILGYNNKWIVVSVNMFSNSTGGFSNSKIYAFNKANLYAGLTGSFGSLDVAGNNGFSLAPAVTLDPAQNTLYMMETWNSPGAGSLRLSTITGAVGSEFFTLGASFPASGQPWAYVPAATNLAPQLGTSTKIAVNDDRIQTVVYRNGSLWVAHTAFLPAATGARSAVQWWQINPGTGAVTQFGRIDDPIGQKFYAFPSIGVNLRGDVVVGYSRFSASQYASANYSYRLASDPAGSLQGDVVLKAGEQPYDKQFSGENRWGDYSMTMVDPLNDTDIWTIQEYAATPANNWGTWWGRLIFQLGAPVLNSPSAGSLSTSYTPALSWGAVSGAVNYEVQIATDNGFSSIVQDQTVTSPVYSVSPALSANTTYYWQVRAQDSASQYSPWSSVWSFRTAILPPALSAPADAAVLPTARPLFTWGAVTGATGYVLQVSTSSPFTGTLVNVTTSQVAYMAISDLPKAATLYWRVTATGPNGPSLPSVRTFSVDNLASGPLVSSPADGSLVYSYTPALDWTDLPGSPTGYQVQVSTTNDFASPIVDQSVLSSGFTVSPALSSDTLYYWRVRGVFAGPVYSLWSPVYSLRTALLSPAGALLGADWTPHTLRPAFTWTAVANATSYNLQVSTAENFAAFVLNINLSPAAYVPTADLPRGTLLYWRVRANGIFGPGNWSPVQAFSSPNPPGTPVLSAPANNATLTGLTPTLNWAAAAFSPDHYEVQISTSSTFTTFQRGLGGAVYSGTSYTPASPLAGATTYYWRVRAVGGDTPDGAAFSEWSAANTFKTP